MWAPPLRLVSISVVDERFSTTVNVPSVEVPALVRVARYDPLAGWPLLDVERRAHDDAMDRIGRAHGDVTLSARGITMMRSWIQAGAKNN